MANPAAQARAKMQTQWPGASVSARGRKSITHQHPTDPSRFALDTHIGPIHYGAGEDQEIDTAWQPSTGAWDYEAVSNDFHCFVRDSVPVGYRYLDVTTDEEVDLEIDAVEWVNDSDDRENVTAFSQVTPIIDDDSITWPEIATGWDVTVQAQTARLAKQLVIDSLANLGSPTLTGTVDLVLSFRFQMSSGLDAYIDSQLWDKNSNQTTSDHIEFRVNGDSVFWFRRPWANDTVGEQFNGSMAVRKTGANLFVEVRIPWSWLQAASYPIEIDPPIDKQVTANADDGWCYNDSTFNSNDNYGFLGKWSADLFDDFMRFTGITISDGSTIDTSYLTFTAQTSQSGNTVSVTIQAKDSADAAAPTNCAGFTGYTAASVAWSSIAAWTDGVEYDSASINSIIQELVDDNSGLSSAAVVLFALDNSSSAARLYHDYHVSTSEAAKLHIEYTAGAATRRPLPTFFKAP